MSVLERLVGAQAARRAVVLNQLTWLPLYAAVLGVLWLGVTMGVVDSARAVIQSIYSFTGFAVYIALLRFGGLAENRLLRLGYAHLLFGVTCIAMAYGLFKTFRMVAVPMLCVVLVSDLRKYSTNQVRKAALFGLTLMLISVPIRLTFLPADPVTRDEKMALAGAAVILGVVALVMRKVNAMRAKMHVQKGELSHALEQLNELATKDGLTGLLNRREMTTMLVDEIRRQSRDHITVCVAMIDIDSFKQINDTHGHAVGDMVLCQFARLAKGAVSAVGELARWGGEEFMFLAPGVDPREVESQLEKMRQAIVAYDWSVHASDLRVNFSAGVAGLQADELLETWVERADRALYKAKSQGRGCTVAATDTA